jgi:hypothetical protein
VSALTIVDQLSVNQTVFDQMTWRHFLQILNLNFLPGVVGETSDFSSVTNPFFFLSRKFFNLELMMELLTKSDNLFIRH